MGRTKYKIHEPTQPHFITCTILNWIPIFTRTQPKLIQGQKMMNEKISYIHQNPVKRGYVDDGKYWRYRVVLETMKREVI